MREQLDGLTANASSLARIRQQRDKYAARIEKLEQTLNEHLAALNALEPQTGLTYRTLLGELLQLEAETPSPIDAPKLRALLTSCSVGDVADLQDHAGR